MRRYGFAYAILRNHVHESSAQNDRSINNKSELGVADGPV